MGTPLVNHRKLSINLSPQIEEEEYTSHIPYTSVVGSFIYGMVCTRPKISHVVSVVSRYMTHPRKTH